MKPPQFDYSAPATLDQALSELSDGAGDARPLAGGQSLVPLLNFRLAAPGTLIDLGRIPELADVRLDQSAIAVGAMTPTSHLLHADVAAAFPLLAAAARHVGHPQIRSRGTVGGSIAHADPAAELPAVALLCDAIVEISGPSGRRDVASSDFFEGLFATACGWDELVTGVRFPRPAEGAGWGFHEFSRRPGDFALAGVGATLSIADGAIAAVAVVAFGVGPVPIRAAAAERALVGRAPTADHVAAAGEALAGEIDPPDTLHGSGAYRRRVASALFERAIADAVRSAGAEVAA